MPIWAHDGRPWLEFPIHSAPLAFLPPPHVARPPGLGSRQFRGTVEPKSSWVPEERITSKWVRSPADRWLSRMTAEAPGPAAKEGGTSATGAPTGIAPECSDQNGSVTMPQ